MLLFVTHSDKGLDQQQLQAGAMRTANNLQLNETVLDSFFDLKLSGIYFLHLLRSS